MKTEAEIVSKLEKIILELQGVLTLVPSEPDQASFEEKVTVSSNVGMMCALAWVLDCEEELRPLVRAFEEVNSTEELDLPEIVS